MPRAKWEPATELLEQIHGTFRPSGTTSLPHHGYNGLMSFVVRECSHSLDQVQGWAEPGLFISYNDFKKGNRSLAAVVYRMGDGECVILVLPKGINKKLPGYKTYPVLGFFRDREEGVKVDISHWARVRVRKVALATA
jgi:hypothetical protein